MVQQSPAARRWSALIDEQERSGQSARDFAAARDINPRTLSWWRCQLGRSRREPRAPTSPVTFDEVRVASSRPEGTVVVVLDDRPVHIVIDHETDLELLRAVLDAVC